MISKSPIFVTQPALPPLDQFNEYLEKIWASRVLTNNGIFHGEFEASLREYLGVEHISLFSNGTIALITALQAMKITGEVITTPFSFVATTHALWWNNIRPVFADIEDCSLNLDPGKTEAAITPQTTAIMPVHVYGNPCDVEKFQNIADTYGLKLIYDAAHAFAVKIDGQSLLNFGDLSILSFHATKAFNTIEGGAIICHDEGTKRRIDYLKNFGFVDEVTVVAPGINGKMNELQASFGILQLQRIDRNVEKRKTRCQWYRNLLSGIRGISLVDESPHVEYNYSYLPIFISRNEYGKSRDELYHALKKENIYTRRYFFPLISQFPTYKNLLSSDPKNLLVAERVSRQVLCLPIYPDLSQEVVIGICEFIRGFH